MLFVNYHHSLVDEIPPNEFFTEQAVHAYRSDQFKSIRAAVRAYSVPKATLRRHLNGTPSKAGNPVVNRLLTQNGKGVNIQRILDLLRSFNGLEYSPTLSVT